MKRIELETLPLLLEIGSEGVAAKVSVITAQDMCRAANELRRAHDFIDAVARRMAGWTQIERRAAVANFFGETVAELTKRLEASEV